VKKERKLYIAFAVRLFVLCLPISELWFKSHKFLLISYKCIDKFVNCYLWFYSLFSFMNIRYSVSVSAWFIQSFVKSICYSLRRLGYFVFQENKSFLWRTFGLCDICRACIIECTVLMVELKMFGSKKWQIDSYMHSSTINNMVFPFTCHLID